MVWYGGLIRSTFIAIRSGVGFDHPRPGRRVGSAGHEVSRPGAPRGEPAPRVNRNHATILNRNGTLILEANAFGIVVRGIVLGAMGRWPSRPPAPWRVRGID